MLLNLVSLLLICGYVVCRILLFIRVLVLVWRMWFWFVLLFVGWGCVDVFYSVCCYVVVGWLCYDDCV